MSSELVLRMRVANLDSAKKRTDEPIFLISEDSSVVQILPVTLHYGDNDNFHEDVTNECDNRGQLRSASNSRVTENKDTADEEEEVNAKNSDSKENVTKSVSTKSEGGLCVFTSAGLISIWSLDGKRKILELETGVSEVISGEILAKDIHGGPRIVSSSSILILQSRKGGIRIFPLQILKVMSATTLTCASPVALKPIPANLSTHVGFCKLMTHGDLIVFPSNESKFDFLSNHNLQTAVTKTSSPQLLREEKTSGLLMFLKIISVTLPHDKTDNEEATNRQSMLICYGLEEGIVAVKEMSYTTNSSEGTSRLNLDHWGTGGVSGGDERVGQLNLNDFDKLHASVSGSGDLGEELVSPLCAEFIPQLETLVIGTNTRHLFKIQINLAKRSISFDGRKSLINKGVNSINLHPDGSLLALGSWDGMIRILSLPNLSKLTSISYHKSAINSVVFPAFEQLNLNTSLVPTSQKFTLICGAEDGQLSCWNIGGKLQLSSPIFPQLTSGVTRNGSAAVL